MTDRQTRTAIVQWLVPAILLIAVVIVMLFNFSAKSSQSAAEEVENSMMNVAEKYATKINHELVSMADAGKTVGYLMGTHIEFNKQFASNMAEVLCDNSRAYAIVYCDAYGNATRQDAAKIQMKDVSYFTEIYEETKEKEGVINEQTTASEEEAIKYIYVQDDEIGLSREAIVAIISLGAGENADKLLMYYPVEYFKSLFRKSEFDADAFYFLINPEGMILASTDYESEFLTGENIWATLKQNGGYSDTIAKATVRIKNKTSGSFSAVVNEEERKLIYTPIGINRWTLVVGVNQSYVNNLQSREWSNAKQMVYQLVVAILAFLGLLMAINIIDRIKSRENSKELGEKADTDLLTSLNNKLATERKIKEWMLNHPQEQAMLFVFDIDNFKKINDTLGHAFGDEVLRSLGHQIGSIFRATDVIGRTGGDEFTIFLKHLNEEALIEREAKKLCNFFKNFQAGEYVKYAATASIGAAVYPKDGKDFESLYKAADNALYTAKRRGKNQLAFFGDEELKSAEKKRVEEVSRKRG
ncbi:GGDEF domain-containing protein [Kineothrix sp. MB12-C1]|uniref:GGDEF domain-containing protein n=1 Tax=Kineothrix sp. MB12-C1 TaxID=3070215 RepID=UPI0027D2E7CD|nr:GGDEF domain-containing protein [Kineothrix sp. MB12-C1]WMC94241.1 GGDEF domain-containing protein [Kineothrix sp. MB12-C1]